MHSSTIITVRHTCMAMYTIETHETTYWNTTLTRAIQRPCDQWSSNKRNPSLGQSKRIHEWTHTVQLVQCSCMKNDTWNRPTLKLTIKHHIWKSSYCNLFINSCSHETWIYGLSYVRLLCTMRIQLSYNVFVYYFIRWLKNVYVYS
jgi:hypothetical protein